MFDNTPYVQKVSGNKYELQVRAVLRRSEDDDEGERFEMENMLEDLGGSRGDAWVSRSVVTTWHNNALTSDSPGAEHLAAQSNLCRWKGRPRMIQVCREGSRPGRINVHPTLIEADTHGKVGKSGG